MGLLSRATDTFYAFRFLRLLTTNWEDTSAFKMGILDKHGNVIKKPETGDEKETYTLFHRLVYNTKRMLNKIPFGKTTIASYLTALYLIKEHTGMSDDAIMKMLSEHTNQDVFSIPLNESKWYLTESGNLQLGKYRLNKKLPLPKTLEELVLPETVIEIQDGKSIGEIFGRPVYSAFHLQTKQIIFITREDIYR